MPADQPSAPTAPSTPATSPATSPANAPPGATAKTPAASTPDPGTAPTKSEVQEAAPGEKFVVKVDGKDVEVTREELLRSYSHNKASQRRMQEAAQERQRVQAERAELEAIAELMERNPAEAFRRIHGPNYRKVLDDVYQAELDEEMMPPDERRRRDLDARERRILEAEQAEKRKHSEAAIAESTKRYEATFHQRFEAALKDAGLPLTDRNKARIAADIQALQEQGAQRISLKRIVEQIKLEREEDIADAIRTKDTAALRTLLGPKSDELRLAEIAEARSGQIAKAQAERAGPAPPASREEKAQAPSMTPDEWLEQRRNSRRK